MTTGCSAVGVGTKDGPLQLVALFARQSALRSWLFPGNFTAVMETGVDYRVADEGFGYAPGRADWPIVRSGWLPNHGDRRGEVSVL